MLKTYRVTTNKDNIGFHKILSNQNQRVKTSNKDTRGFQERTKKPLTKVTIVTAEDLVGIF